jgi:5'-nucleotidase
LLCESFNPTFLIDVQFVYLRRGFPMHILVTNDDGVQAPGLLALVQAMQPLGKVSVLAPDHNWSASGHVKTLHRPLRVKETLLADGTQAMASDGAPSDCVALGLLGLVDQPVDLVVSGFNPYANLSHDVTYSGTVTAAMEAAIVDIPAIAFSVDGPYTPATAERFTTAILIARQVVEVVIQRGLPGGVLFNVNIPFLPLKEIQGICITRQGMRIYRDALIKREDPFGHPYYWIGGEMPTGVKEEGTDIGALADGYVSITPLQLDMTAHAMIHSLEKWEWKS